MILQVFNLNPSIQRQSWLTPAGQIDVPRPTRQPNIATPRACTSPPCSCRWPPALTGCAVFEALGGMPDAETTVLLPPAIASTPALDGVAASVQSLRKRNG
jgi:hypothetical protein